MAAASSSSSPPRSPGSRSRRRSCRSCSVTTRKLRRIPPASTWTLRSNCRHGIREIRVGSGTSTVDPVAPVSSGPMLPLDTPLQFLKGVGPRRAADLQRVGLATVEDLLYRFPDPLRGSRHASRPSRRSARARPRRSSAKSSAAASGRRGARASRSSRCWCAIATGSLRAVFFNQAFLDDVFHPHQRVILFGRLELTSHGLQLQNPQYKSSRPRRSQTPHRRRAAVRLRRRHAAHRAHRPDLREDRDADDQDAARDRAPGAVAAAGRTCRIRCRRTCAQRQQLVDRRHGAGSMCTFRRPARRSTTLNAFRTPAQRRLIFEEFFLFQLGLVLRRRRADAERKARSVVVTDEIRESARRVLPFKLTGDQKKVDRARSSRT